MLTDEEIIKIAADTKTGEPGLHGYILPISFAREIERAVLAKSLAQQERLHKEWSELWNPIDDAVRPLTPLGESVAEKALELINMAKAMPIPKQEPVAVQYRYLNHETNSFGEWGDKIKGKTGGFQTRNLYADPQPAQAAAIPTEKQILSVAKMVMPAAYLAEENYKICSFAYALLSAPPKPE